MLSHWFQQMVLRVRSPGYRSLDALMAVVDFTSDSRYRRVDDAIIVRASQ